MTYFARVHLVKRLENLELLMRWRFYDVNLNEISASILVYSMGAHRRFYLLHRIVTKQRQSSQLLRKWVIGHVASIWSHRFVCSFVVCCLTERDGVGGERSAAEAHSALKASSRNQWLVTSNAFYASFYGVMSSAATCPFRRITTLCTLW